MTYIRIIIISYLISFSICFSGCGFIPTYFGVAPYYADGQKFKPQRVSQLVKGSSTQSDVLRLFGDPLVSSLPDLCKAHWWHYNYSYLGILGVETATLDVYFKGSLLEDYKLNLERSRY